MKNRLYFKLLLGYLLYAVLAMLILLTFTQKMSEKVEAQLKAQDQYRQSARIAQYVQQYYSSSVSLSETQEHLAVLSDALSAEIWVVDPNGRLLLHSEDKSVSLRAENGNYDTIADFSVDIFGKSYYATGNFLGHFRESVLTTYAPITVGYQVPGYVLVHQPLRNINADIGPFINVSFYTATLLFLCSFLLLAVFTYAVYKPLRKITHAADSYAKGKFDQKIDVHADDEIGYLARTLNYMASELSTREQDQREFISNVSHDFRSPLTSIKGYVEAMLDGTIPVELQDKYLNIILFETKRLHKLTESLLELNSFGSHAAKLDPIDFDINQTIKTTIMTFEGICSERGITFDLVLTGQELFVVGDKAKLQQVLYNLVDNAVKFSHTDSSIKIETNIKSGKVLISVKDTGIGIPAEGISKIWDRFYKTDLSRGKDKKGTGLGLSIVKEIIEAHGEHISVVSTEGVGTEFLFTLPLSASN